MEQVGRAGKVVFINDPKATNADSTGEGAGLFGSVTSLILGGKAKEGGIRPPATYFPRIAKAYLIGAASDDFAATLRATFPMSVRERFLQKRSQAVADAAQCTGSEPVVLLPACAT
ncbi:MAG: hypothetical protein R3D67_20535 [Hyphomicrobiaceae bacterium]